MLKSLRRRLTLLFSTLTALVLAAALCVTWQMAAAQYQTSAAALFTAAFTSITDTLESSNSVPDAWLAEREAAALCVISIEDNGSPLHFPGAWQPRTDRAALLQSAKTAAAAAGLNETILKKQTVEFTLTGAGGEPYHGRAALLPRTQGGATAPVLLVMVQDQSAVTAHLRALLAQYLLLWLAGAALLGFINWQLAGRALAPTQQGLQRQREFVASASHELRSPLAVIKASLAAANEPSVPPEKKADFLRAAEREADRMTTLTDDLLLLAGSDANVWHTRLAPLPLDTFCIELYDQFYPLARQKGHNLTLLLPEEPLPAPQADEQRLRQLFAILLNNALEYTPADTAIELTAGVRRGAPVLRIIDHGPGIPDSEKEHIFDRFYRADQSRTDKAHFGLGLAVAKEIAALHRATLTVTDTPNGGATFSIAFPPQPIR